LQCKVACAIKFMLDGGRNCSEFDKKVCNDLAPFGGQAAVHSGDWGS